MSDVALSLDAILPEGDSFHELAKPIPVMQRMIREGHMGNKGQKGGFYRKAQAGDGSGKETLDFATFTYRAFDSGKRASNEITGDALDLSKLLECPDKRGRYAWEVLARSLSYAATLVPEVNESLVAVDDAMKLGYNWIRGPFELLDAIGIDRFVARLERDGRKVPDFIKTATGRSFYRVSNAQLEYLQANGEYARLERAPGVVRFSEQRRVLKPILENAVASYFPLPEGIGLVEFHSKANTLDGESMRLLAGAVSHASDNMRGLIIHNDAQHFSCGVNLANVRDFIVAGDWAGLDAFLLHFQQTVLAMKYAPIPVVAAPSGLSLGGGFEVVLHTDKTIFHANSVTGLVETLVGVVPGGGGVKEMLYRWFERSGDINQAAWAAFRNIGHGKTARSPLEAEPLAMLRTGVDSWVMNRDRLLSAAIAAIRELAPGYRVAMRTPLAMPGRTLWQEMADWLRNAQVEGRLTPHDVTTGMQVATIVTGGDIDAGTPLAETDLCALEREAFGRLARTTETRARIEHMLDHGTPLRN
jgi:3-hydroxyacyl-CoA dehydrogenase